MTKLLDALQVLDNSSVRTEGAGPWPENEKEGLTYQNGYFFRGLPSMLQ